VDIEIKATDNEWFVDNKGQKLKIDRRGIRDESRYLLMFPLQKESWISIVDLKTKEVRKTVGVDETVTVSAGTFEGAIKVHTTVELPESKILHSFHYFVAGVGIVKIETAIEDVKEGKMIPQTVTELKKYSVNSAKN
jgi:mannose-6-phosphate isomerase-like protein (cupin superfamily)